MRVVRIIVYEGSALALQNQLGQSKHDGVTRGVADSSITILTLSEEQLAGLVMISRSIIESVLEDKKERIVS